MARCVADEFLSRSSAERRVREIDHLYPGCSPKITTGKPRLYMHEFKVTVSSKPGCPACPRPLNEGPYARPKLGGYRRRRSFAGQVLHEEPGPGGGTYTVEHHGAGYYAIYFKTKRQKNPRLVGNGRSVDDAVRLIGVHKEHGTTRPDLLRLHEPGIHRLTGYRGRRR